ncbi:NDR1/HIN1-like protein 10 [Zingiber officinale]|uniref:Late embryogenesis abundant protein LEA-2 subgroup domain-containing protein n=1 Tax=Zingiber officinale TaxID=94328 RepID=A0A8J5KR55_ZINOF|nr:NDR1/HIN1-like protein 10 [Zingiber officinale]KAG6488897.1 hypothetical protein ZIOFF_050152 [Zingiber officinale]
MSSSAGNPKPAVVTGYPASGSAYPYPVPQPTSYYPNGAPPPPPFYPPPPAYAPPPRYNTTFLRRLLSIAVAVFILLGLLALIFWLVLRPRLPEFTVSSAAVTGFNLSAQQQQLSATFDLNITVHNPNHKMRIYYERVTASVLYSSDILSENSLAPFYQGTGETTVLKARLAALGWYVNSDVARGIESDRGRGDGSVRFNVRVFSLVRFRSGAWRTRWHTLRVYCNDVPIGFGNGTNATTTGHLLSSAPNKCVVNL